jgi:PilZ domain
VTVPSVSSKRAVASVEDDRRVHRRYPVQLDCEYKMSRGKSAGACRTVNISSGGILLQANGTLRVQEQVDLSIRWPYQLDNGCALRLRIMGQVVRIDGKYFAVKIKRYEFRTGGHLG